MEKKAMVDGVKLLLVAVIFNTALTLAGCAGGGRYWREEVALPDGKAIIVERTDRLGGAFDGELSDIGKLPSVKEHLLDIPLPQGGKAHWASGESLIPLAVGIKNGKAYLAASPRTCPDYDRWGRPIPPYVFFKFEDGTWKRISVEEFPEEITKANLLISTGTPSSVKLIEQGTVDANTIVPRNKATGDGLQNIYRTGARDFGACLRRLQLRD